MTSSGNDSRLLRLASDDNICAVRTAIDAGETIQIDGRQVTVPSDVPTGHKIAVRSIVVGEKIFKYGAPIGSATHSIAPGDYVHTHNLKSDYLPTFARGAKTTSRSS